MTLFPSSAFGPLHSQKKDIGLKFCTTGGNTHTQLYIIYSVLWISIKFYIFWTFVFEKSKFWFFESKTQKVENPRSSFSRTFNFTCFGVCWLHFTLKSYFPEAFEYFPIFDPKSRDMTSLKPNFLKNFPTDFAEISLKDAKLMVNKVP